MQRVQRSRATAMRGEEEEEEDRSSPRPRLISSRLIRHASACVRARRIAVPLNTRNDRRALRTEK